MISPIFMEFFQLAININQWELSRAPRVLEFYALERLSETEELRRYILMGNSKPKNRA
jgi:hypothetical protein